MSKTLILADDMLEEREKVLNGGDKPQGLRNKARKGWQPERRQLFQGDRMSVFVFDLDWC